MSGRFRSTRGRLQQNETVPMVGLSKGEANHRIKSHAKRSGRFKLTRGRLQQQVQQVHDMLLLQQTTGLVCFHVHLQL